MKMPEFYDIVAGNQFEHPFIRSFRVIDGKPAVPVLRAFDPVVAGVITLFPNSRRFPFGKTATDPARGRKGNSAF